MQADVIRQGQQNGISVGLHYRCFLLFETFCPCHPIIGG